MRKPRWLTGSLVVTALLLAACSGAFDGDPSPASHPASALAVAPRADGLTGAPVPAARAPSAEFDASRLNRQGVRFPPLNDPALVPASEATWLQPDSLVLGAVQGGEARAYPLIIMQFHHVANDELGGKPYLVTF